MTRPRDADWHSFVEEPLVAGSADELKWDQRADFVVVGYGGAGVAAAIEAREQGLSVIAIDRFDGGGATRINGGVLYAGGGTPAQQEAGVEDTPEEMYKYLKLETAGVVSDKTLKRFCNNSVENTNWMARHGVKFSGRLYPKKTSYPHSSFYLYHSDSSLAPAYAAMAKPAARGHRVFLPGTSSAVGYGVGLYDPMKQAAENLGVALLAGSEARQLITNENGRVLGVKIIQVPADCKNYSQYKKLQKKATSLILKMPPAMPGAGFAIRLAEKWFRETREIEEQSGRELFIRADKGVCLSTGGFIFNRRMVRQYAPKYIKGMPLGTPGDDGSGIRLGQSVGGSVDRMEHVTAWRFINPPLAWAHGMIVNARGERYVNESLYGASIGLPLVEEQDGVSWLILDRKLYKSALTQTRSKYILAFQKYPALLAMWIGRKKAASLESLARKCGFDKESFLSTVAHYNRAAKAAEPDPFQKGQEDMDPIEQGPFCAINISIDSAFAPLPVLTLGGLTVNEETGAVLDEAGQSIPGLYAAGRTAIGVCSNIYVSGLSVADCIFSGRRAGRSAAGNSGQFFLEAKTFKSCTGDREHCIIAGNFWKSIVVPPVRTTHTFNFNILDKNVRILCALFFELPSLKKALKAPVSQRNQ